MLQKFLIGDEAKSVNSPLASDFKLSVRMSPKMIDEHKYMSHVLYARAVGSLMYAMACTRSDLLQAVSIVARYMHDPYRDHWEALRCILWYIKGTVDVGLLFEKMLVVSKSAQVMWILTILVILTSAGPLRGMSLPCRRYQ